MRKKWQNKFEPLNIPGFPPPATSLLRPPHRRPRPQNPGNFPNKPMMAKILLLLWQNQLKVVKEGNPFKFKIYIVIVECQKKKCRRSDSLVITPRAVLGSLPALGGSPNNMAGGLGRVHIHRAHAAKFQWSLGQTIRHPLI